jgi:hypothetical protein
MNRNGFGLVRESAGIFCADAADRFHPSVADRSKLASARPGARMAKMPPILRMYVYRRSGDNMNRTQPSETASWRDSRDVCALSDSDRHLGHIVRAGDGWLAVDATHVNDQGTAFRPLGFFPTLAEAKEAVRAATRREATATARAV